MKERLDKILVKKGLASDNHTSERFIRAGKVLVNETIVDKPGTLISLSSVIRLKAESAYVSRGGYKLKEGLDVFHVSPKDRICIDIGVSTGGFTDCLIKHGARKVYGVDVGYGQIDWKLRQDQRVILLERFNARKLSPNDIPESIDLAVIDVSFISLQKIIPPLLPLFDASISIIALIKPQFELPKEKIAKGGVVREPLLHQEAINNVTRFCSSLGLECAGSVQSPILGAKGNSEFLLHLVQ